MTVTLTTSAFREALRLDFQSAAALTEELERLRGTATEHVERYAPDAPEDSQNEAVVRMAAYLFDQPPHTRAGGSANAFRNSGAARLLLPWREHRAGIPSD